MGNRRQAYESCIVYKRQKLEATQLSPNRRIWINCGASTQWDIWTIFSNKEHRQTFKMRQFLQKNPDPEEYMLHDSPN